MIALFWIDVGVVVSLTAALVLALVEFGRDTSCTTSLKTGRFVSGVRLVAEAAYRRLTTPRGMLIGAEDEKNYGLDLSELVGSVRSDVDAAALPGRIRSELTKDERILDAIVTVARSTVGAGRVAFAVNVKAETALGPFELQLLATDVTTELLRILPEAA